MTNAKLNDFEKLLLESENEVGTAIVLILAWMAASDGVIDESEAAHLTDISKASKHGHESAPIIQLVKKRDLDALQLAAEIIRAHFRGDKASLFIEMAIGMAIADGYLLAAENFILRFLADLLGVSPNSLDRLFVEATGRSLPPASDLSRSEYWEENARQGQNQKDRADSRNKNTTSHQGSSNLENAHSVLGLEVGASVDEIKRAYRRLAHIHHPDRFSILGEEAVAAANITFQRINEAYGYLIRNA